VCTPRSVIHMKVHNQYNYSNDNKQSRFVAHILDNPGEQTPDLLVKSTIINPLL